MKIAYFAGSLVMNLDGVSRVLYQLSNYNKLNNIESIFISSDTDARIENRILSLRGIRLPYYSEYKLSISCVSHVEKKLSAFDFSPDIIHLHSPCTAGLVGLRFAKRKKIPVVATYHTHYPSYLKYHKLNWLNRFVKKYISYFYNQCDLVIVPSEMLKEELVTLGIKNIKIIPHGVDDIVFNDTYNTSNLRLEHGNKKILLYVGRLVWEKNIQTMIDAINRIYFKRDDFVLWIVGKGNAEMEIRRKIPKAIFWGFCDGRKLSQIYATADIFVFPSSTETFGNVTLEAMASKTCCIVANAPGSADLIRDRENGLLFESESVNDLISNIEELLNDDDKTMKLAEEAYQSSKLYKWKSVLDKQKELYINLLV